MIVARRRNVLANRTATVSINRNGLSIEVASIPAVDSAIVAGALLNTVRDLIRSGYEELIVNEGSAHSDHISDPLEDVTGDDGSDGTSPPSAKLRKRIGF